MIPLLKTSVLSLVSFVAFNLISFTMSAEDHTFELSGVTTDNTTPLAYVRVTVYEGSIFMSQYSTAENGKFTFALEFNKNFKITLEKAGYVTEDVSINTILPQEVTEQNMSHQISLKMFTLSQATPFTFDEPVAKVFFNQVIKGFTNEVNYKKTFQTKLEKDPSVHDKLGNSGISEEFKYELTLRRNQPKKEEKAVKAEEKITPAKKETIAAKAELKEEKKAAIAETKEVAAKIEKKITETQVKSTTTAELKPLNKIAVEPVKKEEAVVKQKEIATTAIAVTKEKRYIKEEPKKVAFYEPEKKEIKKPGKEVIVERTRKINRDVIELNGGRIVEYTQIVYDNGGIYYFKNGASISEETYQREIKKSHK